MEPQKPSKQETKEELIERLLAKAELDYKCCGSHCSGFQCDADRLPGTEKDR